MQLNIKLWHVLTAQILFIASLVWAADSRITDLTELTDGNVASGDFVECVDVSDTTDNAAGSSRKCKVASLETAIKAAAIAEAALHGNVFGGSDKVISLVDPVVN